jgi:DNA polymerase
MKILTLDFETYWCTKTKYTLTKMTQEAYIRDERFHAHGVGLQADDGPVVYVPHEKIPAIFDRIPWDDVALLCQNTAFDGFILTHVYGKKPKMYLDTKSMFKMLYPSEKASLANITKVLGLSAAKGQMRTDGIPRLTPEQNAELGEYCKLDVKLTKEAWEKLKPGYPVHELLLIDETIRWACEPKLELDGKLLQEALIEEQDHKAALLAKLQEDPEIFQSSTKFASLLRSMGVEPPIKISPAALKKDKALAELADRIKAENGKLTIDLCEENELPWAYAFGKTDKEFKNLLEHDDELVAAAVETRLGVKSTLKETRTKRLLGISERGTLPVPLIYWGAATGRWSASGGINMQNLPKHTYGPSGEIIKRSKLRDAIKAPDGYSLVVCDLSAIEARVLAWVAGQDYILKAYKNNENLYCAMATEIYGRPVTKADKNAYMTGKVCVLGSGYAMGWKRFTDYTPNIFTAQDCEDMGVSVSWFMQNDKNYKYVKANCPSYMDEADFACHCAACYHIIDTYRDKNDKIQDFWRIAANALMDIKMGREVEIGAVPGLITTCSEGFRFPKGRYIRYAGLEAKMVGKRLQWSRQTIEGRGGLHGGLVTENIVQALSRHIMADQLLECKRQGLTPVFTCHDEIVLCEREEDAELALDKLIRIMNTPPEWAEGLPLACEGDVAKTYGEAK